MNTERLLKLADFLDTLAPEKFDLREIVSEFDEESQCGTVCCAIGWLPVVFPDLVRWDIYGGVELIGAPINNDCWFDIPETVFGLSPIRLEALFDSPENRRHSRDITGFPSEKGMTKEDYTPGYVAKDIRDFVEREGAK